MGVDIRGLFRHGDDGKEQSDWMQDDVTVIEGTVVEETDVEEGESADMAADDGPQAKFCRKCGAELPVGTKGKRCDACAQELKDMVKAVVTTAGTVAGAVVLGALGVKGNKK